MNDELPKSRQLNFEFSSDELSIDSVTGSFSNSVPLKNLCALFAAWN